MTEWANVQVTAATLFTIDDSGSTVCTAIASHYMDGVQVFLLITNPERRNEGFATEVILRILEHYNLTKVYLQPKAFADKPMSDNDLFDWYLSFGFKAEGNMLVKYPE